MNIELKETAKQMTKDLTNIGMSYSRIAYRIGISPSTIQKLVTYSQRTPRGNTFIKLSQYYQKIFSRPYVYGPKVVAYYEEHQKAIVELLESMANHQVVLEVKKSTSK